MLEEAAEEAADPKSDMLLGVEEPSGLRLAALVARRRDAMVDDLLLVRVRMFCFLYGKFEVFAK